ncbi:MAG: hypothetical protein RLY57_250 [Candidatus Parcubacteria bacterium]|jgi:predicted ATPase
MKTISAPKPLFEPQTVTVHKAAILGTVGSGKSTGMARLVSHFEDMGFITGVNPETARFLIESGFDPRLPRFHKAGFQEELMRLMIASEDARMNLLRNATGSPRRILLCDRGLPDSLAYVPYRVYQKALRTINMTVTGARDRYHSAHMLEAAPREFYRNDSARPETYEDAIRMQRSLWRAWNGFEALRPMIKNAGRSFEDKINCLIASVSQSVGMPFALQHENVFRVKPMTRTSIPADAVTTDIEQVYLVRRNSDVEVSIRRRGTKEHGFTYSLREKRDHALGSRLKTEEMISEQTYRMLKEHHRESGSHIIQKRRTVFWIKDTLYIYDRFYGNLQGLHLLSVRRSTASGITQQLPGHIKNRILADVTSHPEFRNSSLARLSQPPST